jgi:hypothetical protein
MILLLFERSAQFGRMRFAHQEAKPVTQVQKDYISERLKFIIEFFKLCWLAIFAVGGASVSLVIGPFDRQRWAWSGAGAALTLVLLVLVWHIHKKMKQLWGETWRSITEAFRFYELTLDNVFYVMHTTNKKRAARASRPLHCKCRV